MNEYLLHFIWKYKPFLFNGIKTNPNEVIEIIDPGEHNRNSGPDFFNAKIKIGNTLWVGNVEMHIDASDWYAHGHHTDKSYNNVILHVVVNNNRQAKTLSGIDIPTITVQYPTNLEENLNDITNSGSWIPCAKQLQGVNPITIKSWIEKMMVERLEQKTSAVTTSVSECGNSWEEAFYRSVVRCFGLKINAVPAELLAKTTPLKLLAKHKDNLFQLEAIMFGQAGLLNNSETEDEYQLSLKIEYNYLQRKLNLKPIDGAMWKFMRLRPPAFPTVRIAQLSMLIHKSSSLFSRIIEANNVKEIEGLLTVDTSEYWKTHYTFGNQSPVKEKHLGNQTIETIILNSVIPFMFAYSETRGKPELKEKSLTMLETLPPEKNSIINNFGIIGLNTLSSFESQALLHLKTNHCDLHKCIFCQIGASILLKSNISLEKI
ncbi:MAG: DUF2851 family protein [Bacteroidales bacterium]